MSEGMEVEERVVSTLKAPVIRLDKNVNLPHTQTYAVQRPLHDCVACFVLLVFVTSSRSERKPELLSSTGLVHVTYPSMQCDPRDVVR